MPHSSKASPRLGQMDPREAYLEQEGWDDCQAEFEVGPQNILPLGRCIDLWAGFQQKGEVEQIISWFFNWPERVEITAVRWPR